MAEIDPSASLFETIQRLRPSLLASKCRGETAQLTVMVDGMVWGGPETLRQLRTGGVRTIEYLCGLETTSRLGMRASGGVLLVRYH